jgi:hypothetical protein
VRRGVEVVVGVRADGPAPAVDATLAMPGLTASVLPSLFASLLPDVPGPQVDVAVATRPEFGLVLQGDASLDVPIPAAGGPARSTCGHLPSRSAWSMRAGRLPWTSVCGPTWRSRCPPPPFG